jgi:hypothetical protein
LQSKNNQKKTTENNRHEKQPKVDKAPVGPIIDLVTVVIRGDEVTARNNARFSKFPVIFPVLREFVLALVCQSSDDWR